MVYLSKALLLLILLSQTVAAKEPVRFFYSSLPPYEYVNESGRAEGLGIKAARQYFLDRNIEVKFSYDSIARGIEGLHRGQIEFSTAIEPSKQLKSKFWVASKPLYFIQLGVFRRAGTPLIYDLSQLPELNVATLRETKFYFLEGIAESLARSKTHYQVGHFDLAVNLIRGAKLDYFLSYYHPQKHGEYLDLEFDQLMTLPVYLIVSKQHPKANLLKSYLSEITR